MKFETIKKDNRKKWIVGVIAILAITSVVFFVSTRANYKAEQRLNLINKTVNYSISDLNVMAIKVQNSSGGYDTVDTVPTSGYTLSSESYCEVNGSKDTSIPIEYKDGKVEIGISKKGTKCYLFFDKEYCTNDLCRNLIAKNEMVHETFTSDSGELIDTGYRYEGRNPNNYVRFNNELWRIIGVFEVETTSGTTESLVKIIRKGGIGVIAWDTYGDYGSNDWTQSDIKTILNGQYYIGEDINYTYRNPSNSHVSSNPTVTITGKSIKDTARDMIENVKWNIGSVSSPVQTASAIYIEERGIKGAAANPSVATWNGYIGLMYPSDYGYAVDSEICPRTTTLNKYGDMRIQKCFRNNWLYSGNNQCTIASHSSCSNTVLYLFGGKLLNTEPSSINAVYPVVYLKSNVSIVDNGKDGSQSKPYDLVLN